MTLLIKTLAAVAAGTVLATNAFAQSAREVRGASPYVTIENEPAPKLIVDPPLPGPLAQGIFQAQYRVENVRILPVFGAGALNVSPRLGHLHISVDDLPWLWADASDNNTVDIAGLPPGQHKVKIELVDANHKVFPGQVVTLTFTCLLRRAPQDRDPLSAIRSLSEAKRTSSSEFCRSVPARGRLRRSHPQGREAGHLPVQVPPVQRHHLRR